MKARTKDLTMSILANGALVTAHYLSHVVDATPQHVNRCLKQLFSEGKVAYTVVPHKGRAQQKRLWCAIICLERYENKYPFETPEYIQERLAI